tara:strand:+ start:3194 stop:4543 length:1350 start_codon:yes stop_codon:yes gene_type:complete
MITSDQSNELIRESVSNFKLEQSKKRRKMVQKMLDYYAGASTFQYIEKYYSDNSKRTVPFSNFNMTKRFIDRMARTYTLGASRNMGPAYDQLTVYKNFKMKHIEKMTTLLGTLATQVIFKEENGMQFFDYQPIYSFDVHMGDDPFNPVAIQYPLVQNVDDVSYESVNDLLFAYWDDTMHKIFNSDGEVIEAFEHNLGVLPFVFTHREHQLDSFFTPGAEDIVNCNELINIAYTNGDIGMTFQAFSQAVITGFYSDEKIQRAGADEVIVLPEGSNYDLVAPKINMSDYIDWIKVRIDTCAQDNHLYVQFAQDGGETPSGVALKIKDLNRYEDWQDDLDLYKIYEHKFYQLERQMASMFGINLPEALQINFVEPEYPMSVDDQIKIESHQLKNNLTTEWKLLQRHNKDLSDQEAKDIVEENKETNKANNPNESTRPQSIFDRVRTAPQNTE